MTNGMYPPIHADPSLRLSRRAMLGGGAALAAAAWTGSGCGARAQAAGAGWPHVDALARRLVESRQVANVVALLGYGQAPADVIAYGHDGFINDRRSDPDSLYRIYSMTKPITGMAALLLADRGLLSLDHPVADFLPRFADMQVQQQHDGAITPDNLEPALRQITIRHLLTHTSGLGDGVVQTGPLAMAYRDAGVIPGAVSRLEIPGLVRGASAPSLAEFADRLAGLPLLWQPGTRWCYSVGIDLLGRVIELVAGQSLDRFLHDQIIGPCGMESTWFQVPQDQTGRLTTNYLGLMGTMLPIDLPGNSVFLDPPPFPAGGAGLVSSPRDYDRFLRMLAGGGMIDGARVLPESVVRLGTSDLFPATLSADDPYARHYGFGAGGRVGKGGDAGIFGWFGIAGTCGLVDMRSGLRHSLFTQYMPADIYPVQTEFPAAVLQDRAAHR